MRLAVLFILSLATATFGESIKPRHWGVGNGITADETTDAKTTDTETVQERSLTDLHVEPTDTGNDLLPFPQSNGPCVQKRCSFPPPDVTDPPETIQTFGPNGPCFKKRCSIPPPDDIDPPSLIPITRRNGLCGKKRCTPFIDGPEPETDGPLIPIDPHPCRLKRCTPVPPGIPIKPKKKPTKFPGGQPCRRGLRNRCTPKSNFDVHDFRLDRVALEDVALDNRVLEG
ncbi:hypothetical protein VTL71DRAFT_9503 [Oculimacula yallundae]|uniref:Uncharacterized protein n=1 Tax=Oculimacula yallundae TaxID=86028 RepID=A0ABR4BS22_9HELO